MEGRKDSDYIRPKLEQSARYNSLADSAVTGMRLLARESIALEPPGDAVVSEAIGKLQELYRRAYGFAPPAYEATAGGAGFQGRMRHKVRSAINEWDLRRLRPDNRPDTVIEDFETGYDENTDLESQTTDDPRVKVSRSDSRRVVELTMPFQDAGAEGPSRCGRVAADCLQSGEPMPSRRPVRNHGAGRTARLRFRRDGASGRIGRHEAGHGGTAGG